MRILLLRANNLRHRALSSILQSKNFLCAEIIEEKLVQPRFNNSNLIRRHFDAQFQSELDFFGRFTRKETDVPAIRISSGELNLPFVFEFVKKQKFDMAITFGVSILGKDLIHNLEDNILGIHLGLSPYYRGSGTNFFPVVNGELSAIGYTLMHLNIGIDTGPIIHQGRAPIVLGDSIHSIGNRNISQMFIDIVSLLNNKISLNSAKIPREVSTKLYKRNDFTESTLRRALHNLDNGLVNEYLNNQPQLLADFPIIEADLQGNRAL